MEVARLDLHWTEPMRKVQNGAAAGSVGSLKRDPRTVRGGKIIQILRDLALLRILVATQEINDIQTNPPKHNPRLQICAHPSICDHPGAQKNGGLGA